MSGSVGVTQKPHVGVQQGSPAVGRGVCAHAWAAQSSRQEVHAEGPWAGQLGPEASGRDVPDACILLGASVGTSGTSEGPAARPPARRPPGLSPSSPGLCPRCPLPWLLLLTPCLLTRTPWPLVLQGRQACKLGRAAGALPRMCVSDCQGPRGRVKLDRLQGAPGCRPVSARPQAQGCCPRSFEGWRQAPGDRSRPCLPGAQGGSASPRA